MIAARAAIDSADEIADYSAQSVGACKLEAGCRHGFEAAQVAFDDRLCRQVHGNQRGRLPTSRSGKLQGYGSTTRQGGGRRSPPNQANP